jgi:hypothetical protein
MLDHLIHRFLVSDRCELPSLAIEIGLLVLAAEELGHGVELLATDLHRLTAGVPNQVEMAGAVLIPQVAGALVGLGEARVDEGYVVENPVPGDDDVRRLPLVTDRLDQLGVVYFVASDVRLTVAAKRVRLTVQRDERSAENPTPTRS